MTMPTSLSSLSSTGRWWIFSRFISAWASVTGSVRPDGDGIARHAFLDEHGRLLFPLSGPIIRPAVPLVNAAALRALPCPAGPACRDPQPRRGRGQATQPMSSRSDGAPAYPNRPRRIPPTLPWSCSAGKVPSARTGGFRSQSRSTRGGRTPASASSCMPRLASPAANRMRSTLVTAKKLRRLILRDERKSTAPIATAATSPRRRRRGVPPRPHPPAAARNSTVSIPSRRMETATRRNNPHPVAAPRPAARRPCSAIRASSTCCAPPRRADPRNQGQDQHGAREHGDQPRRSALLFPRSCPRCAGRGPPPPRSR